MHDDLQGQISPDNLLKHGINNGVILADVLLTRVPFVSYHFQVLGVLTRHASKLYAKRMPSSR